MANRYQHRRLRPCEFSRLLGRANMTVGDFLFLTGTHRHAVERFAVNDRDESFIPTMAHALVLELAADPAILDRMVEITNRYYEGPRRPKGEK